MLRLACLTFLLLLALPGVAQLERNYKPTKSQDTIPADVYTKLKSKLEADKATVTDGKSNVRDFTKELYEKRFDYVVENFNNDYLIVDDEFTPYLQKILAKIYVSNPALKNQTSVYAYRSETPNAMSFGEGTIGFTLGLLSRLETDDQIAFILCHELAHYHERHSEDKIKEFARLNYDKEIRKKLKAIKRSGYGNYTKYKELTSSLELTITQHSRDREFEADSIALTIYLNTSYSLQAPVQVLNILEKCDKGEYLQNIDLKKTFSFAKYPFKQEWIQYNPQSLHLKTEENDSTSTHPNCKARIAAIKRQLSRLKPVERKQVVKKNVLKEKSYFEIVQLQYQFKGYGRALFNALMLSSRYPKNTFVHAMIVKCLYQLYIHQKNHELGKIIALPDNRFDENYDRYLTFIHTLRLGELAALCSEYALSKQATANNDEEFLYAMWLCSNVDGSKQSPATIKTQYLNTYPSGKYASLMN